MLSHHRPAARLNSGAEQLLHDEEKHIDFLETQIELVAKIGLELYAQHHIGELGKD